MAKKPELSAEARAWFVEKGREGGAIGGKRRMATMTKAERQAVSRMGGLARAAKKREAKA